MLTYNLHFSWNWEKRWSYGIFIFYIIFFFLSACLLLVLIIYFAQAILPVRWDKYSKNYDFFLSSSFPFQFLQQNRKKVARRRLELKWRGWLVSSRAIFFYFIFSLLIMTGNEIVSSEFYIFLELQIVFKWNAECKLLRFKGCN